MSTSEGLAETAMILGQDEEVPSPSLLGCHPPLVATWLVWTDPCLPGWAGPPEMANFRANIGPAAQAESPPDIWQGLFICR